MKGVLTFADGGLDMVVHAQSSPRVEVASKLEGIDHGFAVGQVGQDAQLQLPIISNHQSVTLGHISCKSLAHLQHAWTAERMGAGEWGLEHKG